MVGLRPARGTSSLHWVDILWYGMAFYLFRCTRHSVSLPAFCFVLFCFAFHFDSLFTWAHVQAASYAISGTETLVPEEGVKGILFQESSLGRWGVKWLNYGTGFLAWPTCWPYTLLPG